MKKPYYRREPEGCRCKCGCAGSLLIWDFFSPSQILWGRPSENCTRVITPALRHVDRKKFHEDTPTRSRVIVAHTLNFRPNFKFSRLKFFGGPRSQLGCALGCFDQSLACVQISGCSTSWGPKCSLPKNVHLGWSILATFTLLFVDQSSPNFLGPT